MKFTNKSSDFKTMAIKWLCMNQEIKDGDFIQGKIILLNLEKMNQYIFYPIKDNVTIDSCNFIGGRDGLKGELLKQFNLMIYRNELSRVL